MSWLQCRNCARGDERVASGADGLCLFFGSLLFFSRRSDILNFYVPPPPPPPPPTTLNRELSYYINALFMASKPPPASSQPFLRCNGSALYFYMQRYSTVLNTCNKYMLSQTPVRAQISCDL